MPNERERDELINALEDFSTQLADFHSQIIILTSERDNALELYKQVAESEKDFEAKHVDVSTHISKPSTPKSVQKPVILNQQAQQPIDSDSIIKENKNLRSKIESLVNEIEKLQADIQVMVQRQRETGYMANEALTQLEFEINGYT